MTETMEELLARIRLLMMKELGLQELRIPSGWNYKQSGKIVAFVGKKRALLQVSTKLSKDQAEQVLQRVDVEAHPNARLASAGWVTLYVFEEAQLPLMLDWVRKSIKLICD